MMENGVNFIYIFFRDDISSLSLSANESRT